MLKRPHWRFENLEIWQAAADLAVKFHQVAATLEQRRLYRYTEQLRGAGLPPSQSLTSYSKPQRGEVWLVRFP